MRNFIGSKTISLPRADASNYLEDEDKDVRIMAELLMEEGNDPGDHSFANFGQLLTDDGLVVAVSDTYACNDNKPFDEQIAGALYDNAEYPFATLVHWVNETLTILYFQYE